MLVFLFLSPVFFGIYVGDMALHPFRMALTAQNLVEARAIAQRNQAVLEDVSITAADGTLLRAWEMRPVHSNGDAVLLLHGHAHNRAAILDHADMLLRHGYTVLLPDARAHGQSGGVIATYGVLESADIRRWYDWLEFREHPRCIDGLGTSMGAAEILEAMRTASQMCAVVADSPFDSFREASYERMGQMFGRDDKMGRTLFRPVVDFGFFWVRLRYAVNLDQASPEKAVAETRVPVLLIHGMADTNLPIRHSRMIMERNSGRPRLELWEVPGAEHIEALTTDPKGYEQRVVSWFLVHHKE